MMRAANSAARVVGLLLAAGSGQRFDAAAPGRKLEQLINGQSVASRALQTLLETCDAVLLAARSMTAPIALEADALGATVLVPEAASLGMGHSLAALAAAQPEHHPAAETLVVALADMPWIGPATIAELIDASRTGDAIVQPVFAGGRGHPVVFPARYRAALAACTGDTGAREVLRQNAGNVLLVRVNDRGVVRDVDTPMDLQPQMGDAG